MPPCHQDRLRARSARAAAPRACLAVTKSPVRPYAVSKAGRVYVRARHKSAAKKQPQRRLTPPVSMASSKKGCKRSQRSCSKSTDSIAEWPSLCASSAIPEYCSHGIDIATLSVHRNKSSLYRRVITLDNLLGTCSFKMRFASLRRL